MSKPVPKNRVLASKEAGLFRTVLQLYEARQWKKAIKTADQILKKYPEHGETTSMKGLVYTNMGRKDEGLELVKKGVRLDLTSHICWHVFGLVHRADRNYEEALKCYNQAIRFDKENLNILRDLAQLQMHLRQFDGLVESRQQLLKLRPNLRQSWIALAMAYQLNGQLDSAKKTLEAYEKTVKDVPAHDPEHSEMYLYHIKIVEDMGNYEEALDLLRQSIKDRHIVDQTAISIARARLLIKLDKAEEARTVWASLIERNPECFDYYQGYLSTQNIFLESLTDLTRQTAIQTLQTFAQQYPKAVAPRRLLLDWTTGDEFRQLVEPYIVHGITRGIPSLFADLKSLYASSEKQQAIEAVVEQLRAQVEAGSSSKPEPPTTLVWTLYFLVQHYSKSPSTLEKAISLADSAIAHTPTLPELYMAKARALKRSGDPLGASETMANAWRLDLQDRFLNTKNAKYLLRAGFIEEGNAMLGLFTKKSASSPGADLEDMQSLAYLLEDGDAHNRAGKLHLALKRYHGTFKTFDDYEDDQFDFHSYALRKYTFRTYLEFIQVEDTLRSHPAYARAALSAAKIYIRVHDDPKLSSPKSTMTDAEKKAAKKAKKASAKVAEDSKKVPTALTPSASTDDADPPPPKDDDPDGLKLLAASDPLEQAAKRLQPLYGLHPKLLDTWIVSYDVAIRRKKYVQAVKALNNARAIDAESPELHIRIVHFKKHIDSLSSSLPAHIASIVTTGLANFIPHEESLETFNTAFGQRNAPDALRTLATAKSLAIIGGAEQDKAPIEDLVFQLTREELGASVPTCLDGLAFLRDTVQSSRVDEFRAACDARFVLSTVFRSAGDIADLRAKQSFDAVVPEVREGVEEVSQ